MDSDCEHASILVKKMSPFGRAVMEIFNFFLGKVTFGPPRMLASIHSFRLNARHNYSADLSQNSIPIKTKSKRSGLH
jgi:hypothetical protein